MSSMYDPFPDGKGVTGQRLDVLGSRASPHSTHAELPDSAEHFLRGLLVSASFRHRNAADTCDRSYSPDAHPR